MKVVLAILAVLLIIPVIWLMKSLLVKKYVEWFKEGEGKDETKAMEMVLHVLGVGDLHTSQQLKTVVAASKTLL